MKTFSEYINEAFVTPKSVAGMLKKEGITSKKIGEYSYIMTSDGSSYGAPEITHTLYELSTGHFLSAVSRTALQGNKKRTIESIGIDKDRKALENYFKIADYDITDKIKNQVDKPDFHFEIKPSKLTIEKVLEYLNNDK